MFPAPSLNSHLVSVFRAVSGIDSEGTPVSTLEHIVDFRGGFGFTSTNREQVVGVDGQRIDAAVSVNGRIDVRIGDKANVAGRDWKIVGVREAGPLTRVLLASWGVR